MIRNSLFSSCDQILMASLRTLQYRMLLQHLRVSAGAKLLGDITCYFLRYGLDKDKGETEGEYDTNANGKSLLFISKTEKPYLKTNQGWQVNGWRELEWGKEKAKWM